LSFAVNVDGIKDLSDEETSPFAIVSLANLSGEESQDDLLTVQDDILQASLARTIFPCVKELPVYRVSGVKTSSGKPKAKNRARKEVTQLEQRQYRQQCLEAKVSEHKSWADNNVYGLVGMNKHPPKNVKGRWVLTVNKR
jgi:hypothetical protein